MHPEHPGTTSCALQAKERPPRSPGSLRVFITAVCRQALFDAAFCVDRLGTANRSYGDSRIQDICGCANSNRWTFSRGDPRKDGHRHRKRPFC